MKDKRLIFYGNPCLVPLNDSTLQTYEQAKVEQVKACEYYSNRLKCSPPRFQCVQQAGAKMARYVLQFYSEATAQTLDMEKQVFRNRAPFPPGGLEAYIDTPEYGFRRLTDPDVIVERVWEFARATLGLQPGEHVLRSPEDMLEYPPTEPQQETAAQAPRTDCL